MVKIRFFGSSGCEQCAKLHIVFEKYEVEYEYIDAYADDTQELCDKYEVDELPHLQFFVNDKIIFECQGEIAEKDFLKRYSILGDIE